MPRDDSAPASAADPIPTLSRRRTLACLGWAGTGLVWTLAGGIPRARLLGSPASAAEFGSFSFVQISDTHIGFNKKANPDVAGSLAGAIEIINALEAQPDFVIHTGDITHLSKPAEFDQAAELLKGLRASELLTVPGEHDMVDETATAYRERYGKGTLGDGWYSFDHGGVHFAALINVVNFKPGGLGRLGAAQLDWLRADLAGLADDTPVIVFAHMPLWTIYPDWGWGTDDAEAALAMLRRFGSVTVLNGHIHQVMQKVEGNVAFHTALSTAFPQPKPGEAAAPGPVEVPADELGRLLGTREIQFVPNAGPLAVTDRRLVEPS
jgi:3',5'-cyclic-AMP phosphodiesterase